ncbi:MAG: hypothetical protein U9N60_10110 [Thermodesulfobacteriota bacterium]|nr:hypothetical protein [Thermodesulfobacteriota bacterium]
MLSSSPDSTDWNGADRRSSSYVRRQRGDRRSRLERRLDRRIASTARHSLSLKNRLRMLIHPRLGVDRRKGTNQRISDDRRKRNPAFILTQEEISALLGKE